MKSAYTSKLVTLESEIGDSRVVLLQIVQPGSTKERTQMQVVVGIIPLCVTPSPGLTNT